MAPGRRPKLSDFMLNLSRDPQALANFQADPQAAAQTAGLSRNAVQALTSRDPALIQQAVLADGLTLPAGRAASDDVNVTIVVVVAP